MFETIGVPELLIIMVIVVLLFGAGKVSRLGKDLGTSVKEFRRAMADDDAPANEGATVVVLPADQAPALAIDATPVSLPASSPSTAAPQIF